MDGQAPSPLAGYSRPGRILVADDDDMNLRILREHLESQQHEVRVARDGLEALEQCLADPPDTLLLDVLMPKMNGFEVCRRLRADARTAHLFVIIVTALAERQSRIEGVAAGADEFLTKPFDREELLLRVRNAVCRTRLYTELAGKYAELKAMKELRDSLVTLMNADTDALGPLLRGPGRKEDANGVRR